MLLFHLKTLAVSYVEKRLNQSNLQGYKAIMIRICRSVTYVILNNVTRDFDFFFHSSVKQTNKTSLVYVCGLAKITKKKTVVFERIDSKTITNKRHGYVWNVALVITCETTNLIDFYK